MFLLHAPTVIMTRYGCERATQRFISLISALDDSG